MAVFLESTPSCWTFSCQVTLGFFGGAGGGVSSCSTALEGAAAGMAEFLKSVLSRSSIEF